jgi:L-Ala-D/L-Glu epimerase / N-acetyl-D-glutamate racemase
MITIRADMVTWPVAQPIQIARGTWNAAETVVVEVSDGVCLGRGECTVGEIVGSTADETLNILEEVSASIQDCIASASLATLMPACPARNALDCALLDFESRKTGRSVWERFGFPQPIPSPICTTIPLGLDDSEVESLVADAQHASSIKVKVDADMDMSYIESIRKMAPRKPIILDANGSWTPDVYNEVIFFLSQLDVTLLEQPFPREREQELLNVPRIIPICVDESVTDTASFMQVAHLYDAVNIKLDKAGGLTEAVKLLAAAKTLDKSIMLGCNLCTSLGIAPSTIIMRFAKFVDLDAPLFLAQDYTNSLYPTNFSISPDLEALWGAGK